MIPSDLASRLRVLTETTVQSLAAVTEISADLSDNLPNLDVGQRFNAQIQNALPDGTYRALVAGRTVVLSLPDAAKSGDVMELVVTDNKNSTIHAQLAESFNAANPAPKLSQAGQLISQLLTGRFGEPEPVDLAHGQPLLPSPPTRAEAQQTGTPASTQASQTAAQTNAAVMQKGLQASTQIDSLLGAQARGLAPALAVALRQAVSQSGLFFEAHQAQWVDGELPLEALLSEPQAREGLRQTVAQNEQSGTTTLSPQLRSALLANGDAALLKSAQALLEGSANQNAGHVSTDEPGRSSTVRAGEETQGAAKNALRIPDSLMPLVHQQLEALATHHVVWQGQVWPGQYMQWDVYDPTDEHAATGGKDQAREWKSTLRLSLPQLGDVEAQLVLTPAGLALKLDASDAQAAERMQQASPRLLDTLQAAGVPVTGLAIIHHASA